MAGSRTDAENAAPRAAAPNGGDNEGVALRKYGTRSASRRVLADIANRDPLLAPLRAAEPKSTIAAATGVALRSRRERGVDSGDDEKTVVEADISVVESAEIEAVVITGAQLPADVLDIDAADTSDALSECTLALSIASALYRRESTLCAPADYLARHEDISARMRGILIDWLVDVHVQFRLQAETLHLCVNLLDRYLSSADLPVRRSALQLVGVGALLVACKYEEIYAPAASDFVYITDRTYSRLQVLGMEAAMCNTLGWRVTVATALPFVRRCVKALRASGCELREHLVQYVVDLALIDYGMLRWRPSRVAAAACALVLRVDGSGEWNATVAFHSGGYEESELVECASYLGKVLEADKGDNKLNAIKRKYAGEAFGKVASDAESMDVMKAIALMKEETGV